MNILIVSMSVERIPRRGVLGILDRYFLAAGTLRAVPPEQSSDPWSL
jgi:hypothetical protein